MDVIRTSAILLILISHSSLLIYPEGNSGLNYIFRFFGTLGVDIFFVLSGFLIGNLLIKNIESGKTEFKHFSYFWIRRWFKTLPNYFIILLINLILLKFFWQDNIENLWGYFFFLQNFSEAMPDFFLESWSLSIEEFSYIIGPLLLYVLLFLKGAKRKTFLVVIIIVIAIGLSARLYFHFNYEIIDFNDWSQNLRKVVVYRIDSIYYGFFGAYLSYYFSSFWDKIKGQSLFVGLLIFGLLHASILLFDLQPDTSPMFFNIWYLPTLLLSILCSFPYFSSLKDSDSKLKPIIEYISLSSYAIYLVNYSIVLLSLKYIFNIQVFNHFQKFGILILFWILTFVCSYILYNFYERPIMNLREHRFFKPS